MIVECRKIPMEQVIFESSVQYQDFSGSIAADRGDRETVEHWLDARNLLQQGELVCGISLSIGENHGDEVVNPVSVSIYLAEANSFDALCEQINSITGPLAVRRVETVMAFPEFLSLFKRLSLTLSPTKFGSLQGILEGAELSFET
jgi:hypothetical protein